MITLHSWLRVCTANDFNCTPVPLIIMLQWRLRGLQDQPGLYYRDLLSIETVATLNAGFCDYHVRHCPPSEQLYSECKKVGLCGHSGSETSGKSEVGLLQGHLQNYPKQGAVSASGLSLS